MMKKNQFSQLLEQCSVMDVELRTNPEHLSIVAAVPPPWDPDSEAMARQTQAKLNQLSKQYPDVVCYCFDSFSTLLYVL